MFVLSVLFYHTYEAFLWKRKVHSLDRERWLTPRAYWRAGQITLCQTEGINSRIGMQTLEARKGKLRLGSEFSSSHQRVSPEFVALFKQSFPNPKIMTVNLSCRTWPKQVLKMQGEWAAWVVAMESSQHIIEREERCQAGPAELTCRQRHPSIGTLEWILLFKSTLNLGEVTSGKGKETLALLPVDEM